MAFRYKFHHFHGQQAAISNCSHLGNHLSEFGHLSTNLFPFDQLKEIGMRHLDQTTYNTLFGDSPEHHGTNSRFLPYNTNSRVRVMMPGFQHVLDIQNFSLHAKFELIWLDGSCHIKKNVLRGVLRSTSLAKG
jgi:hypothetical protein